MNIASASALNKETCFGGHVMLRDTKGQTRIRLFTNKFIYTCLNVYMQRHQTHSKTHIRAQTMLIHFYFALNI
jgi:hypothetical protein